MWLHFRARGASQCGVSLVLRSASRNRRQVKRIARPNDAFDIAVPASCEPCDALWRKAMLETLGECAVSGGESARTSSSCYELGRRLQNSQTACFWERIIASDRAIADDPDHLCRVRRRSCRKNATNSSTYSDRLFQRRVPSQPCNRGHQLNASRLSVPSRMALLACAPCCRRCYQHPPANTPRRPTAMIACSLSSNCTYSRNVEAQWWQHILERHEAIVHVQQQFLSKDQAFQAIADQAVNRPCRSTDTRQMCTSGNGRSSWNRWRRSAPALHQRRCCVSSHTNPSSACARSS